MRSIENMCFPIADALQVDLKMKDGKLFGEATVDLDLLTGIPTTIKVKIVDAVVDNNWGTTGVLAKLDGGLYLAMINDERKSELTFFVINGSMAGIVLTGKKKDRFGKMDKWTQWSRIGFYRLFAKGVRATFTRGIYDKHWKLESTGSDDALAYVAMREEKEGSTSAKDLNKANAKKRHLAITRPKK